MSKVSNWDRVVMKAWLERNDQQSRRWHPAKAALIYARYTKNIDRADRYFTAERMIKEWGYSTYTPYQRASDHATSYPSYAWKYQYWIDVANIIKEIKQ